MKLTLLLLLIMSAAATPDYSARIKTLLEEAAGLYDGMAAAKKCNMDKEIIDDYKQQIAANEAETKRLRVLRGQ